MDIRPLTQEEIARKQELIKALSYGDSSVFDELKELIEREATIKNARMKAFTQIIESIINFNISFQELVEATYQNSRIFSEEAIIQYCESKGWIKSNKTSPKRSRKSTETTRKKREGFLVFSIQPKGAKGAPFKIMKDDDFPINGIGAKAVWLYNQPGDLKENLLKCADSGAREFLETEEGIAFLNKWADWIAREAPNFNEKTKVTTKKQNKDKEEVKEGTNA